MSFTDFQIIGKQKNKGTQVLFSKKRNCTTLFFQIERTDTHCFAACWPIIWLVLSALQRIFTLWWPAKLVTKFTNATKSARAPCFITPYTRRIIWNYLRASSIFCYYANRGLNIGTFNLSHVCSRFFFDQADTKTVCR